MDRHKLREEGKGDHIRQRDQHLQMILEKQDHSIFKDLKSPMCQQKEKERRMEYDRRIGQKNCDLYHKDDKCLFKFLFRGVFIHAFFLPVTQLLLRSYYKQDCTTY